ncbi:DUF6147 family protein [Bacillus niameyensis]|uniref:DUF6147 family protein n=1 Tax=Bacillus niameyensis TaxID=1522308 RepID=UPI0007808A8C|nr:DUF6147 family protein [Bacillus niameyensis]
MKRFRSLIVLVASILMISLIFPVTSLAAENTDPLKPTIGEPSPDLMNGEGSISSNEPLISLTSMQPFMSNQYLRSGISVIGASGDTVRVSGNTSAYFTVNSMGVVLYLQRWDAPSGRWLEEIKVGDFTQNNTSFVAGAGSAKVPKGYYYRARAHHWVNKGTIVEQATSYTSYIYVK